MGYLTRQPTPNELIEADDNPWGPQDGVSDDFSVLVNEQGKKCSECERVVLNEYIQRKDGVLFYPDCY